MLQTGTGLLGRAESSVRHYLITPATINYLVVINEVVTAKCSLNGTVRADTGKTYHIRSGSACNLSEVTNYPYAHFAFSCEHTFLSHLPGPSGELVKQYHNL